MIFRAQVRNKALQLLQAAITTAGATFTSSKDTPVEGGDPTTPAREIIVYTVDRKTGIGDVPPQFKTEVLITIEVSVEDETKDAAEALTDSLCEIVENTLLGNTQFTSLFEGFDSVETDMNYRGTAATMHTFTAVIEIKAHVTEIFEPTDITDPLSGVNIYVDSVNVFDPNGAFNPPFAYGVSDAPRGRGPDGRDEICGKVDIGPVLATEDDKIIQDDGGRAILGK